MKITQTVQRDCCQQSDLRPLEGTPKRGRTPEWMFCLHCGRQHRIHTFTDPAGASDWDYQPAHWPWEAA